MRCGGSLVDSTPFVRRVAGSNTALAATYTDLVALQRETPTQYTSCAGAPLSSSGLEEVL